MNMTGQFIKTETQRYALVGALFGLLFPVAATALRVLESGQPLGWNAILAVQASDKLLWIIDTAPLFLGLFAAIAGRRQDRSQQLNIELNKREQELRETQRTLEKRVAERTVQLERKAVQLQAVAHVARAIASVQNIDELLPSITRLVSEQFAFYHAGIFLVDENREYVVLSAANSPGGQKMLANRHKLALNTNSIVGYATSRAEPRIALDVGTDSVYFNNPELPETRSELALPLKVGGRVIGALDVQSTAKDAFTEEDVATLSTLADQIAIAIENARLFSEARTALGESQKVLSETSRAQWSVFAEQTRTAGYLFDGKRSLPLDERDSIERPEPLPQTGRLTLEKDARKLVIPIRLRGQTIGLIDVTPKNGKRKWTQDDLILLEAAAERAALALENARLVDAAQRRASRERTIGEISTKIGAISDMEAIMQAAVEELGRRIGGGTEVVIELESRQEKAND